MDKSEENTIDEHLSNKIKEAARKYAEAGLNIVPVDGKKPLIEWGILQKTRQSKEDFEQLPWNRADGFAVVGGSVDNEGNFFCVIDLDVKSLPSQVIEKGKRLVQKLPVTQMDKTPSGGWHLYFLSRKKAKTISVHRSTTAVELLGKGKLIVIAPSLNYSRMVEMQPLIVEDLEADFHKALSAVGEEGAVTGPSATIESSKWRAQTFWFGRQDLASEPFTGEDPPCIREIKRGLYEGLRNEATIRLASYYLYFAQLEPAQVSRRLKAWNKFNRPPLAENELQTILSSALQRKYNYGCHDNLLQKYCNPSSHCLLRSEEPNRE